VIRAVVFDFDGVIANSEPLHLRAFQDVLAGRAVALSRAEYYERYLGFDDAGMFRQVGLDRGRPFDANTIAALVSEKAVRMEELERDASLLFPGAEAAVRRLSAVMPLAIASGALGPEIRRILDRERLSACFAAVVAAEDTPASKPSPDPYLLAVRRLREAVGRPLDAAECAAIEDSRWGLESARAAGLRTIAVTHSYPASELPGSDAVLDSLDGLTTDLLERM
jgi:beta-phosphoglucomutase